MIRLAVVIVVLSAAVASAEPFDEAAQIEGMFWMTEQYPPFNYLDEHDGQLKGVTVDVLMEIFKKIGVGLAHADLKVLPWAQSYNDLLTKPNTALFSMTYSTERLQLFKFVGPIIPTQVSIIAPRSKKLTIRSKEDLKGLKIGVIRDDIGDQLIRDFGAEDDWIERKDSLDGLLDMLHEGRLDVVAYAEDVARFQFTLSGIDPNEYEIVHMLQQSHMGYAFHKATDSRVLEPMRKALDELRVDGTITRIHRKYLPEAQPEIKASAGASATP